MLKAVALAVALVAVTSTGVGLARPAAAQAKYPSKQIEVVVPYAPGAAPTTSCG
jgi:tripartite-type tricarboxylate transporter receptor subunit TctC